MLQKIKKIRTNHRGAFFLKKNTFKLIEISILQEKILSGSNPSTKLQPNGIIKIAGKSLFIRNNNTLFVWFTSLFFLN